MRELDPLVSAFPIERAGPAHVATLKTIDPPLSALEGRRLAGAERRAKNLLFPTEDGDLVLRIHLMSAGRIRHLAPGAKGPKRPMFKLRFPGGGELVLTEAGKKKRAGVWLVTPEQLEEDLAHLGPDALELDPAALAEILSPRAPPAPPAAPRPARARRDRPRARERDPPPRAALAVQGLDRAHGRGDRSASRPRSTRTSSARSSSGSAGRATGPSTSSTTASASRARSAATRSGGSTSRSTRSTTAPAARPAGACSKTGGYRDCSASG